MRSWMGALFVLALVAGPSSPVRASTDLSIMASAEIEALQKRLTDDGCYAGAIDGQDNVVTRAAVWACPDQSPALRIETGMHTAQIKGIGVDVACRLMVTGSEDKTVRLWSLPDGRLKQVIRLPIGPGSGGEVHALALSPDGRFVAAGGWDAAWDKDKGMGLYVVDIPSGIVRRIGAFENVISGIAISADGSRIAVALAVTGVRVIETATGRQLMADRDYGAISEGVAFASDGSLYSTSYDGFLRRYSPDLKLAAKVKASDGRRPFKVALNPAGQRLAVGYEDSPNVSILEAQTLAFIAKADVGHLTAGSLNAVAWTRDGRQVVAGGQVGLLLGGTWRRIVRRFDAAGRHVGDTPVSNNTVMDLQPCGDDIAFGTADPSFGLLGNNGQVRTLQAPATAEMGGKIGDAFAVSANGASVRFGLGYGAARPVVFDLLAGRLTEAPSRIAGLMSAKVAGLPITDWLDGVDPKFNGKPIALDPYEVSRSLSVRADRSGFALGAQWNLRSFDAAAGERWKIRAPSETRGVDLAADGSILVAAYNDGTIRWHRWSDGQELLTLFVNAKDKRWVAWTPTGYYMASPGAEDMIGWQVNRGWEQQADFFPASRFRDTFNRPDIVRLVLTTLDEGEAVKQANVSAHKRDDPQPLIERLPPVITIVSPRDGSPAAPGTVEVRYRTRSPSGGVVDRVEAFVDGAKIEARGLGPSAGAPASPDGSTALTLPMPPHDAEISLVAYADGKASDAARIELKIMPTPGIGAAIPDEGGALKPNLYALLIGVTHYENKAYDLAYPAQDAIGLAKALKGQEGRLYRHVEVKVLIDKDATAIAVKKALLWLQKQTTARDLSIVFAAGHGLTDPKGRFWFLTTDADPDALSVSAVSKDDIADILYDLPGKKLLFLDACHSGAALSQGTRGVEQTDLTAAVNDFAQAEGGVVAYAASTGKEFSFENEQWGHGAFTKALLEGIGGGADLLHNGTITTATLDAFLENRVKELTGGRQHPVMNRPKTVPDFPVATVR